MLASRHTSTALALLCAVSSLGATFVSPRGYRFEYPDDWRIAPPEMLSSAADQAREMKSGPQSTQRPAPDVMIYDPDNTMFPANLNVVIAPGAATADEDALALSESQILDGLTQAGADVELIRSEVVRTVAGKCLSHHYRLGFPDRGVGVRQWLIRVPGPGATYVVTCTTALDEFEQYEGEFRSILESLAPKRTLATVWRGTSPLVRALAMGILIALIAGAVIGMLRLIGGR